MPFSNVPVKNPGRYLEKFVKITQPIGADATYNQVAFAKNGPGMQPRTQTLTSISSDNLVTQSSTSAFSTTSSPFKKFWDTRMKTTREKAWETESHVLCHVLGVDFIEKSDHQNSLNFTYPVFNAACFCIVYPCTIET